MIVRFFYRSILEITSPGNLSDSFLIPFYHSQLKQGCGINENPCHLYLRLQAGLPRTIKTSLSNALVL